MAVVDAQGLRFDWRSDATPPRDDAVAHQLPRLVDHLKAGIVVGHNLQFDFRFVTYESRRLSHTRQGNDEE
jgi:DNA polymerase III epsilon subunit-like protein